MTKIQKRTPTPKQKKAAKAYVENLMSAKPVSTGQVLRNVGFTDAVAHTPKFVTDTVGFKQALRELGLTEELITTSLVSDIKSKPKNRLGELRLGAEILGINKREDEPEKPREGNTYNFIFSETVQKDIKEIESLIKDKLTQRHETNP